MLLQLLMSLVSFSSMDNQPHNALGIEVGSKFSELSPDTIDLLNHSKHWKVDNREYTSTIDAPNTDNCFVYDASCKPDYEHYVFKMPNNQNQGYFYIVTFSYNYHVLKIEDTFLHTTT